MNKKVIIAGGGTGGHIFPAVAIANALKKIDPSIEILFVGAKGKMEMEKVPKAGYRIIGLDIAGFNRSSLIKNIALPFKLVKSFFQVRNIFKSFKPDAAVGVGGYSTFPVLRLAQAKGISTFIHESNSFAGKSNMLLGKRATKCFVAIDGMEKFFPAETLMVTGNPVRKNIVDILFDKEEALQFFKLDPTKKTVFIVGGSLGARSINQAIAAGIDELLKNDIQLIWQTGTGFTEQATAVAKGKKNIWTSAFISEIEYAYAAADVVVSRSGAMSVTELCVAGKPVVFVPYPHAAEDHQRVNAMKLVDKKAAVMVDDADVKIKLVDTVVKLMNDQQQMQDLKTNILKLRKTDADEVIAKEILKSL